MILTNKSIEREKRALQYEQLLADEHHQLALDRAMLLDFVYLVAANKRRSGEYNNSRDDLRVKAGELLSKLNL